MKRLLLALVLLTGCASSSSAYKRAESLRSDLKPVILTAVMILAEGGTEAQAAFDVTGALLSAWNAGNASRFDLLLPCAVAALQDAAKVLPEAQAKPLRGVIAALAVLGAGVCRAPADEDDGGVALWRRNDLGYREPVLVAIA